MAIEIKCVENKPVASNSFVIFDKSYSDSCIIIDPGTEDCSNLIEFLEDKNLKPEYIFLTHEHFDHIWGVNKLKDLYNVKIVCSRDCALKIIDKKKNMSIFYNKVGFETYPASIVIEEINHKLIWQNHVIEFINTEGHTISSICILISGNLFSGDTLIKNEKTVTKLPGGSVEKLGISYNLIIKRFEKSNPKVYAGHGSSFRFRDSKIF